MARKGKRAGGREQKSDTSSATREYKSFKFALENPGDDESGEFSGYAAVFGNEDSGHDVIQKGAFAKTITEDFDRIKILSQHESYALPIGKPLELREDDKGLFIKGKISNTEKGREILTLMRDGVLNELSIGYDATEFEFDSKTGIRYLKEIKLWEVSIVTWAMNDQAKIDDVKSLAEELRLEAKAGKLTQARLNTLKPFIAVVRELVEILGPFLEPPAQAPEDPDEGKKQQQSNKETKNLSGMIFEIVP
jgi:HK97 family phage prohead protease